MNKVILIGNLTRDPETRTSQSGNQVCTFTLAINRRFTNQQGVREADFLNIVTFKQTAENCARYLAKGRKCAVSGSIQTRTYDAQDGTKRYVTEIIADEVQFLSSANSGQGRNDAPIPGDQNDPGDQPGIPGDDDEKPLPF